MRLPEVSNGPNVSIIECQAWRRLTVHSLMMSSGLSRSILQLRQRAKFVQTSGRK